MKPREYGHEKVLYDDSILQKIQTKLSTKKAE